MSTSGLSWLEYNIHILRNDAWYPDAIEILTDLVKRFVERQRAQSRFTHWHYLIESDRCREKSSEIRVRFQGNSTDLNRIRDELISELNSFSVNRSLTVRDGAGHGSHTGCHGNRNQDHTGESDKYGQDWPLIVEILQIGSDSALEILSVGKKLMTYRSRQSGVRDPYPHEYYLHLPANQLLVEP